MTDARGASTTLGYTARHLVSSITYGVPAGVQPTANVSFAYDAAGNRTQMNDGLGSASYTYDSQSRLTHESRDLNGVGVFNLTYGYDKAGRVSSVGGANYGGVTTYASALRYRAFGSLKQMTYGNDLQLSTQYDNRTRLTRWDVAGRNGWGYSYDDFQERTGRVTYAHNLNDPTLHRSYDYDHVGRLFVARTGVEARSHTNQPTEGSYGPYSQHNDYDQFGNITARYGWGTVNASFQVQYTNNRRNDWQYDAAGNVTGDGARVYQYDATGQQTYASLTALQQGYDGDALRVKKTENGQTTYYLRSSVLGGQVAAEITSGGTWQRGYVYLGGQLLAVQAGGVFWSVTDPVTKSPRLTNSAGSVTSVVELDPWGGETQSLVNLNTSQQPRKYTTYERDANSSDEAMMRRLGRWGRFEQPDPYNGSYDLSDPQSFNRYAYTQNDPVNFFDPTGLDTCHIDRETGQQVCIPDFAESGGTVYGEISRNLSSPLPGNHALFGGVDQLLDTPTGEPGGGGAPQNTDSKDSGTDCTRFADEVGRIASRHLYDLPGLANALNRRFAPGGERRSNDDFASTGFKSEFKDDTPSRPGLRDNTPNQVRHYVGGFRAFAQVGVIGKAYADYRESPGDTPSHKADLALNRVSTRHARTLAMNPAKITELKDMILKDVCQ